MTWFLINLLIFVWAMTIGYVIAIKFGGRPRSKSKPLDYPIFYAVLIDRERVAEISTNLYRIRCRCIEEHAKGNSTRLVTYEARKAEGIV